MEQTITISEQKVVFRADGATPLRYRAEFKRDYFADMLSLVGVFKNFEGADYESADFSGLDTEVLSNIIYLLAKTAEKGIGDMLDWFGSFDNFPLFDVFMELEPLIMSNMQTIVKKAKKK